VLQRLEPRMLPELKRGDRMVWNGRLVVVLRPNGAGSAVWTSGARSDASTPDRIYKELGRSDRVLVELLDGTDPPAGYSAWVRRIDLSPAPTRVQLELPFQVP